MGYRMSNEVSPLFLERYELKFLIPSRMVEPIRQFIAPYCHLDHFCQMTPTNYYRINSLYLDSYNNVFFKKRQAGVDSRFNMRIRSYTRKPQPPYFLEVKYKTAGYVKKYRTKVDTTNLEYAVFGMEPQDDNHRLFAQLATVYGVEPKVMTSYDRMAFLSHVDDYARVTFDRNLKCYEARGFETKPDDFYAQNYDHEGLFPPDCDTVLELKSTTNVPLWMLDLIRYFDLERSGFSKYCNSFIHVYQPWADMSDRGPGNIVSAVGNVLQTGP